MSKKAISRKMKFIFDYEFEVLIDKVKSKIELLESKNEFIPQLEKDGRMSFIDIYNFIKQ